MKPARRHSPGESIAAANIFVLWTQNKEDVTFILLSGRGGNELPGVTHRLLCLRLSGSVVCARRFDGSSKSGAGSEGRLRGARPPWRLPGQGGGADFLGHVARPLQGR